GDRGLLAIGDEPVGLHPGVVEDLGQVAAAAVGQDDHHDIVLAQVLRRAQCSDDGHAGGAADEQALLAGQPPGHGERFGVGDGDDLVGDRRVVVARPHVLADALDEVGAPGAAGVDGAVRVRADDLHGSGGAVGGDVLEVAAGAGDRAAGAGADDHVGQLPVGGVPDLGAGGLVVAVRGGGVVELVGLVGAGDLGDQAVGDPVVGLGGIGGHRGGGDDDLGTVGTQHVALFLADLVRGDEDGLVALRLGHQGQPDAGVARRRLHDGAAGPQFPGLLRLLDHLQRDAVLDGPSGVQVLEFHQDGGPDALGDLRELHQGGVADEFQDGFSVFHGVDSTAAPPGGGGCTQPGVIDGAVPGRTAGPRWNEIMGG